MKKRVFWTVITAGLMLSGCATNSFVQAEKGLYQPKNELAYLPEAHPLARICSADILKMAQTGVDIVLIRLPVRPLGYECRAAKGPRAVDPGARYECSVFRIDAAMSKETPMVLSDYSGIPKVVATLAEKSADVVAHLSMKPGSIVPTDTCPEKDSLIDQFRLASALHLCNDGLAKSALAETRQIDEKIAAAAGVIEFHTVKLTRLAPSGIAHILLGGVYGISKIEPCVAKSWAGNPEAFVAAAIDAAKAIVLQPIWMPRVRDLEIGMFIRRIHDVAKAIDPATNKPWLTKEQRQRLSAGLLSAFTSKDFNFIKDRKKESWPSIDNLSWVLTVGTFFRKPDLRQTIRPEILYMEYRTKLDAGREKLRADLIAMASAIAGSEGGLPESIANQYPVEASEAYQQLIGDSGSGAAVFNKLFR